MIVTRLLFKMFVTKLIGLMLLAHIGQGKSPHIVFVLVDDMGWDDIGFNNPDIISPHINSLAEGGVILNQSYVQPVCSATRAALMTSYYPFRLGLQHSAIHDRQPVCVPLDKTFLPEVLKTKGYKTHILGKWHMGFCKWECTATYRGFDTYYGYYTAREDYYTKIQQDGFYFHKNKVVAWSANETYSTYTYLDELERVVKAHDPADPFFLYFPIQSVHEPMEVPKKYYDMYSHVADEGRRTFSGMVTALDDVVGRLVSLLKEKGMYDDTIIVFSSDNGGAVDYNGSNYPLRGGKFTIWEGGTRVPAFVHSKRLTKTGVRYDGLIHVVDWFPTLVEAAEAEYEDPDRDGISQWLAITTLAPSNRTEFIYNLDNSTDPVPGHAAIRMGDYKLIEGLPGYFNEWYTPDRSWAFLEKTHGCFVRDHNETETTNCTDYNGLFNLKDDPYEHNNLYTQLPDVVQRLKSRMSYYYGEMVPRDYPPISHMADPVRWWGGVWEPGWC